MHCLPDSDLRERFAALPGVGDTLAQRLVEAGIVTLEDLELAAHDGRLAEVPGFGAARVSQLATHLDDVLGHHQRKTPLIPRPPVATLLALDEEYRGLVAEGVLPHVAPRRFNPHGNAWLPVWHPQRDGWAFTIMFSNTARAYRAGTRRDWVLIVYQREGQDDLCTVVTEHRGELHGRRVIRGREAECAEHYRELEVAEPVRRWVHEVAAHL